MKVGILGAGAYAMALSSILSDNNCNITMWTKFIEEKNNLEQYRKNEKLIQNFKISSGIKITTNLKECVEQKDLIIIAIPVAFIDELCQNLKPYINGDNILIASKGIEQKTGLFIDQIIKKHLNTNNIAILSGPTFAVDIPQRKPIGLTIATKSINIREIIDTIFINDYTKIQYVEDIIGVELCGSIKNIFSIASGILEGLNCNESTMALFLNECLYHLQDILEIFHGERNTALSYAGIGDLILTCTSKKSRNYTLGYLIGSNKPKKEIEEYINNTTTEGYHTLISIKEILTKKNITFPIIDIIYDIILNDKETKELLKFIVKNNFS